MYDVLGFDAFKWSDYSLAKHHARKCSLAFSQTCNILMGKMRGKKRLFHLGYYWQTTFIQYMYHGYDACTLGKVSFSIRATHVCNAVVRFVYNPFKRPRSSSIRIIAPSSSDRLSSVKMVVALGGSETNKYCVTTVTISPSPRQKRKQKPIARFAG